MPAATVNGAQWNRSRCPCPNGGKSFTFASRFNLPGLCLTVFISFEPFPVLLFSSSQYIFFFNFFYLSFRLVEDNSANADAETSFIKSEFRGLSVEPCVVLLILLCTFA